MMTRRFATLAIMTAGLCTTAMNWRFSFQLGTSQLDSHVWATFSVALDVSKWLMLPLAALAWSQHKARAVAALSVWLMATVYSFTAAVGFAALNRDGTLAGRLQQAELHKTLEVMKSSARWTSSAACADATAKPSKNFCAAYKDVEARLTSADHTPDPQAALFSRILGLPQETVRLMLALFLASACEMISALGLFAVLPPSRTAVSRPQAKALSAWTPSKPAVGAAGTKNSRDSTTTIPSWRRISRQLKSTSVS